LMVWPTTSLRRSSSAAGIPREPTRQLTLRNDSGHGTKAPTACLGIWDRHRGTSTSVRRCQSRPPSCRRPLTPETASRHQASEAEFGGVRSFDILLDGGVRLQEFEPRGPDETLRAAKPRGITRARGAGVPSSPRMIAAGTRRASVR
jgi:hypothetical protein